MSAADPKPAPESLQRVPPSGPARGVRAGDILADKYRVEQVLGAGGMGVVVAAEHIDLRERVAIKFLLDDAAADSELSERFLREARAAVKIKSEHVVRIIDVGRLASGSPYMVMEYLEGEDLSQRLERGAVNIADAVDYVIQCCEAMNVAHRAGIVHRDLKPANLFLTQRPDGSPIVKVLDFGISKVAASEGAQLNLTRTQAMMGSPLYMSPEQMRSSKDVDRRTDVWSLGVILHELIAGDVPFSGDAFPEVLLKVMTEAAPPLRSRKPEVPAALEAIVLRCLAKAPADRFPSVAALAVALSPFASARTLNLQSRLSHSVSQPPPGDPAAAVLGATRLEGNGPASQLASATAGNAAPSAHGTLPSAVAANVASAERALPQGTNTNWEDAASLVPRSKSGRWPMRLGVAAGIAAFAAGMLLLFSSNQEPATATPSAASSAPAKATALPEVREPAAPQPVSTTPEPGIETTTPSAPAVAPVATAAPEAPATTAPAPAKTRSPERRAPKSTAAARSRPMPAAKPAVSNPPTVAPAPAPKPPATRSKPLSLEFK